MWTRMYPFSEEIFMDVIRMLKRCNVNNESSTAFNAWNCTKTPYLTLIYFSGVHKTTSHACMYYNLRSPSVTNLYVQIQYFKSKIVTFMNSSFDPSHYSKEKGLVTTVHFLIGMAHYNNMHKVCKPHPGLPSTKSHSCMFSIHCPLTTP